ncbi:hypothetical protein C8R43DRAFT_943408 [Mycena crocata]|nr:hypothetical protein C8R43DRAFT_943408 [Mycena crocata]
MDVKPKVELACVDTDTYILAHQLQRALADNPRLQQDNKCLQQNNRNLPSQYLGRSSIQDESGEILIVEVKDPLTHSSPARVDSDVKVGIIEILDDDDFQISRLKPIPCSQVRFYATVHFPSSLLSPSPTPPPVDKDNHCRQGHSVFSSPGGSSDSERQSVGVAPKPSKRRKVAMDEKKPKIDASAVTGDVVAAYLADVVPLDIDPPVTDTPFFSRKNLHGRFGGNPMSCVTKFSKAPFADRPVMLPMHDANPYMPTKPGDPGVFFSVSLEATRGDARAVSIRQNVVVGTLTPQQFAAQSTEFKLSWATRVAKGTKPAYREMRARISLRKAGRAVTPANVAAEVEELQSGEVTADDAMQALIRGEEAISVVRMTCVSYDHEFLQVLIDARAEWEAAEARGTPAVKRTKIRGKAKGERKPGPSSFSDSEQEDEGDEWLPRKRRSTHRKVPGTRQHKSTRQGWKS